MVKHETVTKADVDAKILTHKGDTSAHHTRYTDAEAPAGDQGAKVYHSVDQNTSNYISTILAFDSEEYDTDNIHDTVTNNSRLTCKTAGKYIVLGYVYFVFDATGVRMVDLLLNDETIQTFRIAAISDYET
ncbi:unnamed protein product, partial [marine sediment metagenome]